MCAAVLYIIFSFTALIVVTVTELSLQLSPLTVHIAHRVHVTLFTTVVHAQACGCFDLLAS